MNRTVLITGASGGIGYQLAKTFAREGFDLILVARSENKLLDIKKQLQAEHPISVVVLAKDLFLSDAAEEIFQFVASHNRHIDILVNNAGLGDFGEFVQSDWDKQNQMIQLNITSLVRLTRLFLEPMLQQGNGRIMNLSSQAAFAPGPLMSVYYASKAFVLSFSEALSRELKGSGVTVTALCPGTTQTGFEDAASLDKSKLFQIFKPVKAEAVAEYGYQALMAGKPVAVYGLMNKLMVFGVRFTPRSWVREIVYQFQGKRTSI